MAWFRREREKTGENANVVASHAGAFAGAGKAAATILSRVLALFGDGAVPAPAALLEMTEDRLRTAGLSRNKIAAIRDLAARTLDGTVPNRAAADPGPTRDR